MLILKERHLRRVVSEYVTLYNEARPHQGLEQRTPIPDERRSRDSRVHRRDMLGGLLHDYYRQAA